MNCKTCGKTLCKTNKTGFCRVHLNQTPEAIAKMKAGLKRFFSDPENKKIARERLYKFATSEKALAAKSACAKRINLSKIGNDAQMADPTFIERRVATYKRNYLKRLGVPREQWDTYWMLRKQHGYSRPEAIRMCLEKHEAEMARWRREIAA